MSAGTGDIPPWSDDLARRFALTYGRVGHGRSWWTAPHLVGQEHDGERRRMVRDLEERERRHGPPTRMGMDRRLQVEAELDPAMPAWVKRPWYVPREHMLIAEEILVGVAGFGYSASTSDGKGEYVLRGGVEGLGLLVMPVPGMLPKGREAREVEEARVTAILAGKGLVRPRIVFWNDCEPDEAFHGMLVGTVVRTGCVALGIPAKPSPAWE